MSAAEPPPERHGGLAPERARPRRRPSRFLAPLALIAVTAAVVIVVTGHSGSSRPANPSSLFSVTTPAAGRFRAGHHHRGRSASAGRTTGSGASTEGSGASATGSGASTEGSGASAPGTSATGTATSATGTRTIAAGTYTIQSGDTFAAVSAATGVPITTIEKLNPRVSSSALTVGQVIKLK